MNEVTESEFEKNFDEYMDRIEAGETFIIRLPDGRGVAAVPAQQLEQAANDMGEESWYNIFSDHDDAQ